MAKGHPKTGGRKAGTPNKRPTIFSLREKNRIVYNMLGGDEAYYKWAREHETEFRKLHAASEPREISGPGGGPIQVQTIAELVKKAANDG